MLGAGFSRSLGGPLLYDMFSKRTLEETLIRFPKLPNTELVELYSAYQNHRPNMGNIVLWQHAEEFLDYVDTARKPGPRQAILKRFIKPDVEQFYGQCVTSVAAENSFAWDGELTSEPWLPYVDWAKTLTGLDSIITFNYDQVLERLGEHAEVKHLGRKSLYGVSETATSTPRGFATIYKLHGSTTWVKPESASSMITLAREPAQLLETPFRMLLASPGPTKKLHRDGQLKSIWDQALVELKEADAIVFVGYRFPPSDSESRRLLLKAIQDNDRPDLRIHIVLGQPDASSTPAIERLKSLLRSVLSSKRGEGPRVPENERHHYFEVIVHPLYAEDFFTVMSRDAITDVTYPPYKT